MVERFFKVWSRVVLDHPRGVAAGTLAALAVFGLSIFHLRFETDFNSMIPTRSGAVFERIARAFGMREQSFLVVESPRRGDGAALLEFARAFAGALEGDGAIAKVSYGFEGVQSALMTNLLPYAPRYAPAGEGEGIERLFTPADIDERIERQLARLSFPGLGDLPGIVERDPLDLGAFLWSRFAAIKGTYRFDVTSPHSISEDGRAILIRVLGRRSVEDIAAARATAGAIDAAVGRAFDLTGSKDFRVHAGGSHFLARESEAVVRADLIESLSLSAFLVLALIAWIMRRFMAGLLVLPPLLIGLAGGLGLVGLSRSSIATLSLAGACIEVGLGVDFAIHLLQAAITERALGLAPRESVEKALIETGPSLLYAAMTTVVAFLTFPASRFQFLSDMGLMTGFGVLISLIATVTVLPPLLRAWLDSKWGPQKRPRELGVQAVVGGTLRIPRSILALVLVASAAAAVSLIREPPALERDLRNIHSRDSKALYAEKRLEEIFGGSQEPLLLLLEADDAPGLEDRLRRLERPFDQLVEEGMLAAHVSAAMLLPQPESEGRAIRRLSSLDPESLRRSIFQGLDRAGFDASGLGPAIQRVAAAAADPRPITLDRLRELGSADLLESFVRPDPDRPGRVLGLVTLFPSRGLWSRRGLADCLRRIHDALAEAGVEASPTGLATISAESADLVVSDMSSIGGLTAIAVGILTLLQFRRLGNILLAFVPVTLGCLWTAALLNLLGYRLHFMNASVLPMVIGIGIDCATHLLHRHGLLQRGGGPAQGDERIREAFRVTGGAAALSSITIMLSFGSLAFSANRGLASVGVLSFIGVGASLLASITFLPAALAIVRKAPRHAPGLPERSRRP